MTIGHNVTGGHKFERSMARSDRRQREFELREQDILDAALVLFSKPNWGSVSMEQVAVAADVGKGTLYKHFTGKDELLFRLMLRFYRGLLAIIQSQDDCGGDILQQYRNTFEQSLQYHHQHREYRFIIEYCSRIDFKEKAEDSWHASFMELDDAFSRWGNPKLEEAMVKGLIEVRSIEHIHIGLHACFDGAVKMIWAGKDWCMHGDLEDIFSATIDFLMAGLIGRR
ncbi:MAG: TetR/AcrR family transcriptional regulator [Pseudomonadota bacterium]